jgi:DNA repair exonuclease SbcCD ATPase subunit
MGKYRIPQTVQNAIQNARKAEWDVSIRNEKVIISAPDATAITIGVSPNSESLKQWEREAKRYNLLEGPARTPAEAEALLKAAEEEAQVKAQAENEKRKAYEAEQAKKAAQAKEAQAKAAAATANGMIAPEAPKAESKSKKTAEAAKSIFPAFDKSLVGTRDYSKFQLPDGRLYCVECLGEGIEFIARAPQGLATHRGFRHQMYQGEGTVTPVTTQETSRVHLPEDVQEAFELLRSIVADHVTDGDTGRIAELEAAVAEAKQQHQQDLKKADADYQALKKTSDEALKAMKDKVHQLTQELTGKDGKQQAEVSVLMKNFQALLAQIEEAVNSLSPIKAVAKVDELIAPYLAK